MIVVLPTDLQQSAENDCIVGFGDKNHLYSTYYIIEFLLFFFDHFRRVSKAIMHRFYFLACLFET